MNILLIHQYFLEDDDPGGSRFNEMTKVWTDAGHQVTVLAGMMHYNSGEKRSEYKGKYFKRKSQDSVKVIRSHVSEAYNKNFMGRLWAYFSFVFSSSWAGIFYAREKYDIILVTSPPLFVGITAYLLSLIKRIPFVFEVRDLWPESAIDTGVVKNKWIIKFSYWFEKFIYNKATAINVLTPAFKEALIKKNIPAEKIFFIPNAADFTLSEKLLDTFDADAFRSEKGFNGKFVITYVGAHGVSNHLIQILEAADKLRDTNVIFQLIGDGMLKKELVKKAAEMKLDNVLFVDPVPKKEVFKYILASDMGTSVLKKVDTFKTIYSNKTFDYMACKKPVLLLIDGVSRQLVEDAKCGFYAEPENIDSIVNTVKQCTNTSDLEKLGENGYTYARKHFDRVRLAQKYSLILRKVTETAGFSPGKGSFETVNLNIEETDRVDA